MVPQPVLEGPGRLQISAQLQEAALRALLEAPFADGPALAAMLGIEEAALREALDGGLTLSPAAVRRLFTHLDESVRRLGGLRDRLALVTAPGAE